MHSKVDEDVVHKGQRFPNKSDLYLSNLNSLNLLQLLFYIPVP
jgi:hypothetical protein